ncbi:hypothetical protein THAOC_11222 [Thalassiosira oceanica]|uniref:Uncharacterized protein n=1 Tax=Thalassiosira oceanica TaxID=159749 RepID=K0SQT9_THAOC|nr:hypothetical protein THAOC_11222 [Thalassiosira oceanica]|eukprot:EJK67710.1 hypothetical protein THAOC_11222 [Thalassiosira oceanica]
MPPQGRSEIDDPQGRNLGVSPPAPAPDENPGQDDPIVGRLVDGDGGGDSSAIKDDASALENKNHVLDELTRPASNARDPTPDPHRPTPDAGQSIPLFRPRHQPRVTSTTGTGGGSHTGCLQGAHGATNGRDTTNAATNSPGRGRLIVSQMSLSVLIADTPTASVTRPAGPQEGTAARHSCAIMTIRRRITRESAQSNAYATTNARENEYLYSTQGQLQMGCHCVSPPTSSKYDIVVSKSAI